MAASLATLGIQRNEVLKAWWIEVPPVEPASDQISTPKVSDNGLDQTSNLEVLNGGSDRAVILFNGLSEPSFNGLGNVVLDLEDPCSTEAVDVPSLLAPRRSDNIHFKLVPKGENIIRPAHQHIKSFKVHHFQGLVCSVLVFSGAMVSIWFL
ncbi:hypothetical protein V6N13_083348 [Hibiscus sabdariffa]